MIIAPIAESHRYFACCPHLATGFDFLNRSDLASLPDGRHEIDGDNVFAIVAHGLGRGQADSPLEVHRKYLDIQYVVSGIDMIGWLPLAKCRRFRGEFDIELDLGFFDDQPATWCRLGAGEFAIFFPEDAHAPLGGNGPFHKVVVKVAVD